MQDAENEYIFYDDVLRVSTKSKEFNSSAEIEYSDENVDILLDVLFSL
jgi:hypothetical protein